MFLKKCGICIVNLFFQKMTKLIGADACQKGRAAEMRTYVGGQLRQKLNGIVHSGDQGGHGGEFYDPSNEESEKAEKVLQDAERQIRNSQYHRRLRMPQRWAGAQNKNWRKKN